jgi:hypothetical protein
MIIAERETTRRGGEGTKTLPEAHRTTKSTTRKTPQAEEKNGGRLERDLAFEM